LNVGALPRRRALADRRPGVARYWSGRAVPDRRWFTGQAGAAGESAQSLKSRRSARAQLAAICCAFCCSAPSQTPSARLGRCPLLGERRPQVGLRIRIEGDPEQRWQNCLLDYLVVRRPAVARYGSGRAVRTQRANTGQARGREESAQSLENPESIRDQAPWNCAEFFQLP